MLDTLSKLIVNAPSVTVTTAIKYANVAVAPDAIFTTTVSKADTWLFVTTNATLALGAICALEVVIVPQGALRVTPAALLPDCVTVPYDAVVYPNAIVA